MQVNSKFYLIVGEVSGDAIGAKLMTEITKLISSATFCGIGGSAMEKSGFKSFFKYDLINLMGFVEILPHIFRLQKLIRQTVDNIIAENPNILITIDSPGFSCRVAKLVRQKCPDMKMVHIVAPSVWAYKPRRAAKFAAIYNHMLTLLPFEPPYFEKAGLPATYIGHPVFDQEFGGGEELRKKYNIAQDAKVVVMTPGSRKSEVARFLPVFLKALGAVREQYKNLVIVMPLAFEQKTDKLLELSFNEGLIAVNYDERLAAYSTADVALAKSGTNTLEIAASNTPMIVAYKMNFFTYLAVRLMIKIKYASLINIVADKEILPEFLQNKMTAENLAEKLLELLDNPSASKKQVEESMESLKKMGFGNKAKPAEIAARVIVQCL